jgi:hypothetical protein
MLPSAAILLGYQERIGSLQATAAQLRYGQMIAIAIMATAFLAMGVLAYLAIARHAVSLPASLIPLPLAIYAGKTGRSRNKALLNGLRLQEFYQRGVDRLEGRWAGSGSGGEEFLPPGHLYAQDLSVLGEGSLFELLCTCRTEVGRRHLAQSLLLSPSFAETRRRQEAVRELQDNRELREQLHLLGEYSFQQSNWATITEWLDGPVIPARPWLRVSALALSISMGSL